MGTEHNILFSLLLADAIFMASFLLSSPAHLPLLKLLILEDIVYVSLSRVSITFSQALLKGVFVSAGMNNSISIPLLQDTMLLS